MRKQLRAHWCAAFIAVLAWLTACDRGARATASTDRTAPVSVPVSVLVFVREGAITAPDSVRPGWRLVRVEEATDTHLVVLFRLPATASASDVAAFVAELDTAAATPAQARAVGGPEVGIRGDVLLHLTPGVYVAACVRRGADGHRHAHGGESTTMVVPSITPADSVFAAPPPSTHTVRMVDFAYVGPEQWMPGTQQLRIENTGRQDHQLRLARLRDGGTVQAWMAAEDPDTVATAFTGVARIGAGEVAYLPVDLTPGDYIAYCLIADAVSRKPHIELGMLRLIHVR